MMAESLYIAFSPFACLSGFKYRVQTVGELHIVNQRSLLPFNNFKVLVPCVCIPEVELQGNNLRGTTVRNPVNDRSLGATSFALGFPRVFEMTFESISDFRMAWITSNLGP